MWKQITTSALAIAFICFAAIAHAQAYKWKDPNGNTIYSQTPPPLGTPYELVDDASIAATSFGVADTGDLQKKLDESQQSREERKKQEQLLAESEQIKQDNCAQAKTNLTALTSRGQVTIKEGEIYRKLSEEERQERIKQANSSIEEFCN